MGLIAGILGESSDRARLTHLKRTHPLHATHGPTWALGLDAYDGTGGFLDGSYLWAFPRERPDDYDRRKEQARYHNYVETLVDIYLRHLTDSVERTSQNDELNAWWEDVDGRDTPIADYVRSTLGQALASGHTATLTDKAPDEPDGPSQRDDPNRPYLVSFTPPSILDWRLDRQGLAAIKLSVTPEAPGLDQDISLDTYDYLLWDREEWAKFDAKGRLLATAAHQMGVVPITMLRPKQSRRHPFLGKPLITPSVVRAFYNRASEEDVVLRDQAFSLFVVSVPVDATPDDIQQVTDLLAGGVGTTTVTIVKGTADFKTASMEVPATLRENQSFLVAELYRMAHLRFQRESLQAESGEAIRLQRQDLEQTLASMAEALTVYEQELARRFFDWTVPAEQVDRRVEQAQIEIHYPDDFEMRDIETELAAVASAVALDLGPTAGKELKKRTVRIMLPDLEPDTLTQVQAEIDGMTSAGAGGGLADQLRQESQSRIERLASESVNIPTGPRRTRLTRNGGEITIEEVA